jgi:DNA gyrase subunit B
MSGKTNNEGTEVNYGASSIKILKGLEGVRTRPGMYIGDTGIKGLHHLIWEIIDNSNDEFIAGYCTKVIIHRSKDDVISVTDNGRGIPVETHPEEGISSATIVMTVLHAGGKFDNETYKISGGLHGVGASVVNALSSDLKMEVNRDGKSYIQEFKKGIASYNLRESDGDFGLSGENGTKISFKFDDEIFKAEENFLDDDSVDMEVTVKTFKSEIIRARLETMSYLNKGLEIHYIDEVESIDEVFKSENGLLDFMNKRVPNPLYPPIHCRAEKDGINVDFVMTHSADFSKFEKGCLSFANNVFTPENGTHVNGFSRALGYVIKGNKHSLKLKEASEVTTSDVKEGLNLIINVQIHDPQFEGQTKSKLSTVEANKAVADIVKEHLQEWIDINPKLFKVVIEKAIVSRKATMAMKRSRDNILKDPKKTGMGVLPGKLFDCISNNPEETEIYLCEGDSAGGSAKQASDRRFQAILALKGKILNALKANRGRIMENEELQNIKVSLGCDYDEAFDVEKLRYHKIIIMTDADVDGAHIQMLILTYLYHMYRPLLEAGYVYIAHAPLYYINYKNTKKFFMDYEELTAFKNEFGKDLHHQRFKGLGEMNPDQLEETTMSIENRILKRAVVSDVEAMNERFNILMGPDVGIRKKYIIENSSFEDVDA